MPFIYKLSSDIRNGQANLNLNEKPQTKTEPGKINTPCKSFFPA